MKLLALFSAKDRRRAEILLVVVALSAAAIVGQVVLINQATLHTRSTTFQIVAAVAFVVLFIGGFFLRWRSSARLLAMVEVALLERRRRLFDSIRAADLRTFEQLDGLETGFSRDIEQLAAITPVLVHWLGFAALLVGFGCYMALLSPIGALVWAVTLGALAWHQRVQLDEARAANARLDRAWPYRRRLVEQLADGFAQLKMDPTAASALRKETIAAGRELDEAQRRRFGFIYRAPIAASTIFSLGLAVVLFVSPVAQAVEEAVRLEIVIVLFFSTTAIVFLMREMHSFTTAERAMARLDAVDAALAKKAPEPEAKAEGATTALTTFERIELRGASFSYIEKDRPTFTVGPIDVSLQRGEVVFITGSNGSGKTTLMKLLTGLYPPDQGQIWLDGRRVIDEELEAYRSLFTSVFMDHHLFGPAYGLDVSDKQRVYALLRRFNLEGIVTFKNGRFDPLDLSTGQKKRLAMVVALLEDRPIYVLDEWAAHQDPYLRRYFYETLVPEMRAAGKTVVAISHDARFFHLADRRLHLVDGRLVETPPPIPVDLKLGAAASSARV